MFLKVPKSTANPQHAKEKRAPAFKARAPFFPEYK